jgi:hypothetical protein
MPQIVGARRSDADGKDDRRNLGAVIALDGARGRPEATAPRPLRKATVAVPQAETTVPLFTLKSCGHDRHVGPCPACQRAQLARWNSQLAAVAR